MWFYSEEVLNMWFYSEEVLNMRTHVQHDRLLLVLVDGLVGAVDPGVGAQVSEPHVRVPGRTPDTDRQADRHVSMVNLTRTYPVEASQLILS